MFIIKLYHFLFGYVTLQITGLKPERFINMLINLRVRFWGIEKDENGLRVKIPSRYAKKAMFDEIAKKTHNEYKIIKQNGFRFVLERHKYRLGLYTGIIIGIFMIYFSTFFIWDVKIVKSDYPFDGEIIELLENLGCKTGVFIKDLDVLEIQNKAILSSNGKISWLAVNIKGTVANIEVKKTEPKTEIIDRTSPVNIVASRTGKIIYIDSYEGRQIAIEDTTVQKGDLLISGAVESEMSGVILKHASGKILAETTRTIEIAVPFYSTETYYTEKKTNKSILNIFGKNLNLYLSGKIPIEKYDKTKTARNITLFNAVVLPIKITTYSYREFEEKKIKLDEKTAKDIAISKINSIIDSRFGGDENIIEIKSVYYDEEIADDYFYMMCTVDLIENIAEEAMFDAEFEFITKGE